MSNCKSGDRLAKAEEIALEFNCIAELEEKVDVIEELLKEEEEMNLQWYPVHRCMCNGSCRSCKPLFYDAIRKHPCN